MSAIFDVRSATPQERAVYTEIQQAVIETPPRRIAFQYRKGSGEVSERVVEPYEVIGGDQAQLIGWDVEKDATRRFFLAGMEHVRVDEPFAARFPVKILL